MNTQQALQGTFDYFSDLDHEPGHKPGVGCVYYANGGNPTMCAVGCLIPKKYREDAGEVMGGIDTLLREVPALEEFFAKVDPWILGEMQGGHDSWANPFSCENLNRETFLDYLQTLMWYSEELL